MNILNKIKNKWAIIGCIILLLVVWGIYQNPDRKTENINADLQQIITSMNTTMQQAKQSITENSACFSDESMKTGKSADCVINIRNIQDVFKTGDKTNFDKLEAYYRDNQNSLNSEAKSMIENSLKLYKSDTYSGLMSAYDQYFEAYIEWNKYLRDYIDLKGIDNMTEDEIMMAKTLAQKALDSDENIKLKTNAFNDYLHENFSQEFISSLTTQLAK